MLEHLLVVESTDFGEKKTFIPEDVATSSQVLSAKIKTHEIMKAFDVEQPRAKDIPYENALATVAFARQFSPEAAEEEKKKTALSLTTPEAMQKAQAMLTAYDWQFVEQAANIRAYVVTSLVNETTNTKPEVRLKALKMLGDVTEVGLFTQRTEVVTRNLSDQEIEQEIKKRLEKLTINPDTPLVERVNSEVDDDNTPPVIK